MWHYGTHTYTEAILCITASVPKAFPRLGIDVSAYDCLAPSDPTGQWHVSSLVAEAYGQGSVA